MDRECADVENGVINRHCLLTKNQNLFDRYATAIRLHTFAQSGINLLLAYLFMQRLGNAANFECNGFNGGPQGGIFVTVIMGHAYSAFAHFRGKTI